MSPSSAQLVFKIDLQIFKIKDKKQTEKMKKKINAFEEVGVLLSNGLNTLTI